VTLFDWMRELNRLAEFHGYSDLVKAYYNHFDHYVNGSTPAQELARLIEQEEKLCAPRSVV